VNFKKAVFWFLILGSGSGSIVDLTSQIQKSLKVG
jgi:hypothetical protein